LFSIQTPVEVSIDCKIECSTIANKAPLPPPPKLVWDPTKAEIKHRKIASQQNLNKLNDITASLSNAINTDEIDKYTKEFTDLLFGIASKCLKLAKRKAPPKKTKKKPWFNSNCEKLKSRLKNLSKLFSKNLKDPYIKGQLFKVKKEYRKILRFNKNNFETKNIEKLQTLSTSPKEFWGHLKKLNNKLKSTSNNTISADTWTNHFSVINKKDPALNPITSDYCNNVEREVEYILKNRLKHDNCVFLDKPFTLSEVKCGLKRLKKGKASGWMG
jgi:Fe-S-cluster containining protein